MSCFTQLAQYFQQTIFLQNLDGIKEQNSTDRMIDYLKKKKFNDMLLYHDGSHYQLMNVCENESKKYCVNLLPQEYKDL